MIAILALTALLPVQTHTCPTDVMQLGCKVSEDLDITRNCVNGECTASLQCTPLDLCSCGIESATPTEVRCAPCQARCGNGVCDSGEGTENCPHDCSAECVPGDVRLYGGGLQECNYRRYWDMSECPSGTAGLRTPQGIACTTYTASTVSPYLFQLLMYTDRDGDGCGGNGTSYGIREGGTFNGYDNDDSDASSGPYCHVAEYPRFEVPPIPGPGGPHLVSFDPSTAPSPGPLAGCDPNFPATCCRVGATTSLALGGGQCGVSCQWAASALEGWCPCGVDWANSSATNIACLPCNPVCGDGFCDYGETIASCGQDCGRVCEDGRRKCTGNGIRTCVDGDWVTSPCPLGRTCRERDGVPECFECTNPPPRWYHDADGDGLGNPTIEFVGCHPPPGFADNADDLNDASLNEPPVAVATPDGALVECTSLLATSVPLDGSQSSDPDGHTLSYQWGPANLIAGANGAYAEASVPLGGPYEVQLQVSDGDLIDQDTASFSVVDTLAPNIACSDETFECGAGTPLPSATAVDQCEGPTNVSVSPAGPYTLGSTTLTWTAADSNGLAASCQATLTIQDTQPPSVSCQAAVAECSGLLTPVSTQASATDACDPSVPAFTTNAGPYPLGVTAVRWTGRDDSGNTGFCDAAAVVIDTRAPVVTLTGAPRISRACTALGQPWTDPGATANDVCEGPRPVGVSGSFDPAVAGSYLIGYSATDSTGHIGSTTRQVIQEGYDALAAGLDIGRIVPASGSPSDAPSALRSVTNHVWLGMTQECEQNAVARRDAAAAGLPAVRIVAVHRVDGRAVTPIPLANVRPARTFTDDFSDFGSIWFYVLDTSSLTSGKYVVTLRTSDGTEWYAAFSRR